MEDRMRSHQLALQIQLARMARSPWLWGVTGRWFPGKDVIRRRTLTARTLKKMRYSDLLQGDTSYHVLEVRDGGKDIEVFRVGGARPNKKWERPRQGEPILDVLVRHHGGVLFLASLKWNKRRGRTFVVYTPPRGAGTISEFCEQVKQKEEKKR